MQAFKQFIIQPSIISLCRLQYWLYGVETTHGFWPGVQMNEGLQQMKRRAGGEEKGEESVGCGCQEEWLRGFKPSFAYLCLSGVSPLSPLSFPSFPHFFLPLLPPITQLFNMLHSFSQPLSACQWLHCPLRGLWLWLSLLHFLPLYKL